LYYFDSRTLYKKKKEKKKKKKAGILFSSLISSTPQSAGSMKQFTLRYSNLKYILLSMKNGLQHAIEQLTPITTRN
jgi:hypothetical protein